LKKSLDAYQREKYPELSHSLPEHGKQKEAVKAWYKIQKELHELEHIRSSVSREVDYERVRSLDRFELGLMEQSAFK